MSISTVSSSSRPVRSSDSEVSIPSRRGGIPAGPDNGRGVSRVALAVLEKQKVPLPAIGVLSAYEARLPQLMNRVNGRRLSTDSLNPEPSQPSDLESSVELEEGDGLTPGHLQSPQEELTREALAALGDMGPRCTGQAVARLFFRPKSSEKRVPTTKELVRLEEEGDSAAYRRQVQSASAHREQPNRRRLLIDSLHPEPSQSANLVNFVKAEEEGDLAPEPRPPVSARGLQSPQEGLSREALAALGDMGPRDTAQAVDRLFLCPKPPEKRISPSKELVRLEEERDSIAHRRQVPSASTHRTLVSAASLPPIEKKISEEGLAVLLALKEFSEAQMTTLFPRVNVGL